MPTTRRAFGWVLVAMVVMVVPGIEATELLDLNTATVDQLSALPGLGAERAKMIVRVREKSGPFRALEEMLAIPRLTGRQLDELKGLLYVADESGSDKTETKRTDSGDDSRD